MKLTEDEVRRFIWVPGDVKPKKLTSAEKIAMKTKSSKKSMTSAEKIAARYKR